MSGNGAIGTLSPSNVASTIKALRDVIEILESTPEKLLSFQLHLDPYGPEVRKQTVQVSIMAAKQKPTDG